MAGARFSTDDRRSHKAFWQASDRIQKLRTSAKAVCSELGTADADVAFRVASVLGDLDTPVPRSFGRFLEGDSGFENKPWALTALCWAMCRLCEESASRLADRVAETAALVELKAEA